MTRATTRTSFSSSQLIRTLVNLDLMEHAASCGKLPEKLGQWIGVSDAIALSGVLTGDALPSRLGSRSPECVAMAKEFASTRRVLEKSLNPSGVGVKVASVAINQQATPPTEDSPVYSPYRRFHQAQQRHLEAGVRALRAKVRNTVAGASPALRQLAMLDARFENVLVEHEAKVLAAIPPMLEKRFNQLRKMQTQLWLPQFLHELHTVLLSELDFRLQPTIGLLEALNSESNYSL